MLGAAVSSPNSFIGFGVGGTVASPTSGVRLAGGKSGVRLGVIVGSGVASENRGAEP